MATAGGGLRLGRRRIPPHDHRGAAFVALAHEQAGRAGQFVRNAFSLLTNS